MSLVRLLAALLAAAALAGSASAADVRLTVVSPQSGATVRSPFAVRYATSGVRIDRAAPALIRVYLGAPGASFHVDLRVTRAAGVALVPDDPRLSGRRTLTFVLARPRGARLALPVVVRDVVIEGRR